MSQSTVMLGVTFIFTFGVCLMSSLSVLQLVQKQSSMTNSHSRPR
jgi:hypothetical protein